MSLRRRLLPVLAAGLVVVVLPLRGAPARAAFTGSNGLVAYTCGSNVCAVKPGSGSSSTLVSSASDPVWTPNGARIAWVTSSGAIDAQAVSGGTLTGSSVQLTPGPASQPTWSSNGLKLAYVNGTDHTIHVVNGDGSGGDLAVLSVPDHTELDPAWSPDGTQIAFVRLVSGHYKIFTAKLANDGSGVEAPGDAPVSLTSAAAGDQRHPSWSPSSNTIVYSSTQDGGSALLYTITFAGASQTKLGSGIAGDEPSFSPDATTIAYVDAAPGVLKTIPASGSGSPTTLDPGVTNRDPDWQATTGSGGGGTAAPVNTSFPMIVVSSSPPTVGQSVSATVGTWSGFPSFTYQWKKCQPDDPLNGPCFTIADATSSFFTITPDLFGWRLRVAVTGTNSVGSATQNSVASDVISALPPHLTVTPPVTGNLMVGETLSVGTGIWTGSQPITFAYQWKRCDPQGDLPTCVTIVGATQNTYVPTVADIGFSLIAFITGTNVAGSITWPTIHTYPIVDKPHFAPSATTEPSISGLAVVGGQLTASIGAYKGDTPIATTMQWQRCDATGSDCKTIASAAKTTYAPKDIDMASTLRVAVTAKNAYGTIVALSATTAAVVGMPPHVRGKRIVGTAKLHYLLGTPYDDVIIGGPGNETIDGAGGYDTIRAGSGNEVIFVRGPGSSRVVGGKGSSTIYVANGYKDFVTCTGHRDHVVADSFDVVKGCEVVTIQGSSSGSSS